MYIIAACSVVRLQDLALCMITFGKLLLARISTMKNSVPIKDSLANVGVSEKVRG